MISKEYDGIINKLDKLTGLYEGLKQELTFTNHAIKRIEDEKLPAIENRLSGVENSVDELRVEFKDSIKRVEDKLDVHMRQPAHSV
ncbi:hypothetical protein HZC34_05835 [Candidatus Saganbacteria bacterium]|nr:hypothetical protein [Candidatus Saganbacteria bacterium]